jgi:hypothetical protein
VLLLGPSYLGDNISHNNQSKHSFCILQLWMLDPIANIVIPLPFWHFLNIFFFNFNNKNKNILKFLVFKWEKNALGTLHHQALWTAINISNVKQISKTFGIANNCKKSAFIENNLIIF